MISGRPPLCLLRVISEAAAAKKCVKTWSAQRKTQISLQIPYLPNYWEVAKFKAFYQYIEDKENVH